MDYLVKSTKWSEHNGYITWWGPNRSGYTDLICEAGIYSEDEAKYLEKTHGSNICVAVPYDQKMVEEATKQQEIIISNCEKQIERYKEYIRCEETRIGKANQIRNKLKERLV